MKRSVGILLLAVTFLCSIPVLRAIAADAGDPIFPLDLRDKARGGVVYENIKRGLDVTAGPGGAGSIKADALYLRIHTDVGQTATIDFDIGAINPKGGDYNYIVGAGLRLLVFDTRPMRISVFTQLHYAPIETRSGSVRTEYDYIEIEGGVLFTLKVPVDNQVTFLPYAGPVLSVVRLDGDVNDGTAGSTYNFDAEEKNLIGLAAGLALKLKEHHSIRAEVRYFDELNFSLAAALAF